jgi:hypothetical protein
MELVVCIFHVAVLLLCGLECVCPLWNIGRHGHLLRYFILQLKLTASIIFIIIIRSSTGTFVSTDTVHCQPQKYIYLRVMVTDEFNIFSHLYFLFTENILVVSRAPVSNKKLQLYKSPCVWTQNFYSKFGYILLSHACSIGEHSPELTFVWHLWLKKLLLECDLWISFGLEVSYRYRVNYKLIIS